ncbi:molybdenum cofactor cytidylyltransferase [Clostridium faecium]
MVNAVIMASGYSTRMGKNKLLLPFRDRPIIEHVIDAVKKCTFNEIILVGKDSKILDIGKSKNILTVLNTESYKGQSQSIKLGILNTSPADGYMFFTADQPLIDSYTINLLLDTFAKNKNSIIVPRYTNKSGSPTIFSVKFKEQLLDLQGDIGGRSIIHNNSNKVLFVDLKSNYPLLDVDTIKDYENIINTNL